MKKRGETVRAFSLCLFRLLFSAPLPYSLRLSPLSEHLEQATPTFIRCISAFELLVRLLPSLFCLHLQGARPPYVYVFEHKAVFSPLPEWFGVVHGMEIAFVLGAPFKGISEPYVNILAARYSGIEKGLSLHIMKLWTDFAKYGYVEVPQ